MLTHIKLLLGITDQSKDALLELLTAQAEEEAYNYTHNNNISDTVIEQMVVYRYNTLGTEGVKSESFSGINYAYITDYPDYIIRLLQSYRKVITIA